MIRDRRLFSRDASSRSCCSLPAALPRLQPRRAATMRSYSCRASLNKHSVSLTRAQQRCLSAERRKLSASAQRGSGGSAGTQEPQATLLMPNLLQPGSGAAPDPLQDSQVRRGLLMPGRISTSQPRHCLTQPPAVCRLHVLARSFVAFGAKSRCMCCHAAAGRQAVPRLRCGI